MHDYRRSLAPGRAGAGCRPLARQPGQETENNPQLTLSQGGQP